MKVIMTGGGTGGHIYPAIAIADEIKRRYEGARVLFIGAEQGMEKDIVPQHGYDIELIDVKGFYREKLYRNVDVLKKLRKGNKRAKAIIRDFGPDVVIGTGGYASAPVVKMAQKMGIPTYIHEQNAFPGLTNKMLERKVDKLFLGFEDGSRYFRHPEKHVTSGNPVRDDFLAINKEEARASLGIGEKDFMLLTFGGSQGAGRINKAMLSVMETFNGVKDIRIFMATGSYYYNAILKEFENKGIELESNINIMEYIYDMPKYLAASDLVISRSGALTVAEVTVCGKPAIFIPSPNVTGNHQYYNAKAVSETGGAVILEEKELDNNELSSMILRLKNDPEILKDMSEKSRAFASPNAVEIICDNIRTNDMK